ncbi:MAG: 1-(5-phosphoribosyl)-5-[(5-phosphoribosylamino)methylideneamino]imidazole-4-carboxamide isomerase [Proteobacteria bacterium]|nr:1-(5-phosphoribosyl)-5-[(5-phosphoribosylamino)methylideneamino]imidazole-4-carboxamide isomerase [Pseudomonadota bacterium]
MRIVPAIDLKDGRCVRLFQGDFDRTTEYSANPAEIGRRFSQLDVADLHVVDLDGARSGAQKNRAIVTEIAALSGLGVQLGGGIRGHDDVAGWLDAGVSRCVLGSVAVYEPEVVTGWLDDFGADRIVLALDVRLARDGTPMLTAGGWTEESGITLWDSLDRYDAAGAKHVLCTDVSRDGTMAGPNFALYGRILERYPALQLQASGGVRDIDDLELLREIGVPAAITGRALLDGKITPQEIASFRRSE